MNSSLEAERWKARNGWVDSGKVIGFPAADLVDSYLSNVFMTNIQVTNVKNTAA